MLDSDVAKLYNYDTKRINETVKRNIKRFPEEFCFQLTKIEYEFMLNNRNVSDEVIECLSIKDNSRSQIATLKTSVNNRGKYKKYLPYVFNEQGIAMLSGLLRNDIAIEVSIKIMNAFVLMRKFILNNSVIFERINQHEIKLLEHDHKFDMLFDEFQKEDKIKQKIFYNGQIYDAYSLIV